METLTHIPSNMTNDECFRLTGALPTARIVELLDEGDRFRDAAQTVKEQMDAAHDGMPCEDFAEDIVWSLAKLRDAEALPDGLAPVVQGIIDALDALQADLWERTKATGAAIHLIEDALAEWTDS